MKYTSILHRVGSSEFLKKRERERVEKRRHKETERERERKERNKETERETERQRLAPLQCLQKVFTPLDLFPILLCYSQN